MGTFLSERRAELCSLTSKCVPAKRRLAVHFCATQWPRRASCSGRRSRDRKRDGRAKDVVGIVTSLGIDEPLGVPPVTFRDSLRIVGGEKVRIPAGQSRCVERLARCTRPLPVSLLREPVLTIAERGEN